MSLAFYSKPVAVIKGKCAQTGAIISIPGVTTANTTPANAKAQIDKLLGIGGQNIIADTNMTRVRTEEVVDNG